MWCGHVINSLIKVREKNLNTEWVKHWKSNSNASAECRLWILFVHSFKCRALFLSKYDLNFSPPLRFSLLFAHRLFMLGRSRVLCRLLTFESSNCTMSSFCFHAIDTLVRIFRNYDLAVRRALEERLSHFSPLIGMFFKFLNTCTF